jgi:aspartate/methionine/tyrosine aminotransferase
MKFEPFKMAQFSGQWPVGSLQNMHSSNPQPMVWQELSDLTQTDLLAELAQADLAYETTQGNEKLRGLLSQHYHQQISADEIVLTSGAQEGIFLLMNALLKPGDHMVTFTPCFEPLVKVAQDLRAEVSTLPLLAKQAWNIDWEKLEAVVSNKTQLLVINFPHNPTGSHISIAELQRLVKLCADHDCWLFSDEVFRGLEHRLEDYLPSAADLYDKAISMGVMSKALALPGIRLGWLSLQNKSLLKQIMTIKSQLSICQSSLDAKLCQVIIPHSKVLWQRSLQIITDNKNQIEKRLFKHPRFSWQAPKATATAFIHLHEDAMKFASELADKKSILVMPNDIFLTENSGFRLTLGRANSELLLDEALC